MPNTNSILLVGNFLSAVGRNRSVSEDLAIKLQAAGVHTITTSSCPGRFRRLTDTLSTIWNQRHKYSVANVEVYSGWAFALAEAACWMLRRTGKPYILTLHGGNLPQFAQRWPTRVRRLLASAKVVTAPSRYLLEQLISFRSDMRLIPNPLDVTKYEFRIRHAVQPQLIWLRAFADLYQPEMAVRVLAELKPEFPTARLIMVGPDKGDGSWQRTQHLAKELHVANCLEMPGGVAKADVQSWLQRGDLFLNTTSVDNTPISVLEAQACGLPVISTNVGGLPYLIEHGETGVLVSPDSALEMAAAVKKLLQEPALGEHLSRRARAAVETFDWSVVLPQWLNLIEQVTNGNHAPVNATMTSTNSS